jgi:hypothetical protein
MSPARSRRGPRRRSHGDKSAACARPDSRSPRQAHLVASTRASGRPGRAERDTRFGRSARAGRSTPSPSTPPSGEAGGADITARPSLVRSCIHITTSSCARSPTTRSQQRFCSTRTRARRSGHPRVEKWTKPGSYRRPRRCPTSAYERPLGRRRRCLRPLLPLATSSGFERRPQVATGTAPATHSQVAYASPGFYTNYGAELCIRRRRRLTRNPTLVSLSDVGHPGWARCGVGVGGAFSCCRRVGVGVRSGSGWRVGG